MSKTTIAIAVIIAALLAPPAAAFHAKIRNKGGGDIILTDRKCMDNGERVKSFQVATSHLPDGRTILGCWTAMPDEMMVYIIWRNDGDIYSYPFRSIYEINE